LYTYELRIYDDKELRNDVDKLIRMLFDLTVGQLTDKDWLWSKEISTKYKCDKINSINLVNIDWEKLSCVDVHFFDNGDLMHICFLNKNGEKDGFYTEWWSRRHNRSKGTYKNGKHDGKWTHWYENGQKEREGTYKDGKKDGLWTKWDWFGHKEREGTYKDGVKDGKYTELYVDGEKYREGTYKDGLQVGEWIYYKEDGFIDRVEEN
jgi:antitoxin component YwqK of YwqJK toxin-antitoxin module